ncbi:epidermal growth factor receptor kinase substrate 8-like protein 3b isoform X1 [Hypanus sabinus]|uniref:epidermal growth factor receptor kinase substrate 8-like protein 3b isoform X1 n=1 Tax=Hypanus sabinus TaxID=79690 RepID=UPI0028C453F2|nr:epidermal growth factor receptor kinase substrate 8-like protein 3b isoform X1 [Hypanus sabinus]XP_059806206.1 epidermal growth factor receptor kinase substrate 8-like protein 3b isoform X1 [Hypanus sabinus]
MYGLYRNQQIPLYDDNHSLDNVRLPEKSPFQRTQSVGNRPNAKAIYQQRKAYAQKLRSTDNLIEHRVEHLISCDHDLNNKVNVEHCIQQLRKFDAEGKVWGQDMLLQLSDTSFTLADLETKDELENFPIDDIQESHAILNKCIYNSILAVTISRRHIMKTSVFLFQCEEVSADLMHHDVQKKIMKKMENGKQEMPRHPPRNEMHFQPPYKIPPVPPKSLLPDYDNNLEPAMIEPRSWTPSENDASLYNEPLTVNSERDQDILNHVLDDIELFTDKLQGAIVTNPQLMKKKKKLKKIKEVLPPEAEYRNCIQKIKYAFNLLGKLESQLDKSKVGDLVHCIFQSLHFILEYLPEKDLAMDVIVPLLIPSAIELLTSYASAKEKKIWSSLGDAWYTTRSDWPNSETLEPYNIVFSDGSTLSHHSPANHYPSSEMEHPTKQMGNGTWQNNDMFERQQKFAKAIYDFKKRNPKELTVIAGDVLEVLEASNQWCKVKDRNGAIGHIPHNILEFMEQDRSNSSDGNFPYLPRAPQVTMDSTAGEVTAWLQDKGYSRTTVMSLGVLTGSQLLSLSEQELTMVSANEGYLVYSEIHRSGKPSHPAIPPWKTSY